MKRETSVQAYDLPHEFVENAGLMLASLPSQTVCACGRAKGHELHQVKGVEKSSARTKIVTEKGV